MDDSNRMTWPAPAKINLFLHITGRRADGYHDLQTLFQIIDLVDDISIRVRDDGQVKRVSANYPVAEQDDLAIRAALRLRSATQSSRGAEISVHKRIPMGAGLGGASTDAATVLLVLNQLWNCGLDLDTLADVGKDLGADLPVFVRGASAMASGIGEVLEPVSLGERHYVLIFSPFSVATSTVFGDDKLPRDSLPISPQEAVNGGGRNDCEGVVLKRHPELAEMFDFLSAWGEPRMTGTGSSVFLSMPDRNSANSAAREIKCRYNVRAVRGWDRSPVHQLLPEARPIS